MNNDLNMNKIDDTISRQAAIEACGGYLVPASIIKELPPSQPEQPEPFTSKWIPIGMADAIGGESAMWGDKIAYHVCEKCWEQALERDGEEVLSDFCPHCGAEMEVTT